VKNKSIIFITLIAVIALAFSLISFFNHPKICYIDSSVMVSQYPGAVKAQETFQKETTEWQDHFPTLEKEIETLGQLMVEKGSSWSKQKLKEEETKLQNKQKDYYRYRSAIEDKAAIREAELMQPVFDELNALIAEYASENRIHLVLGTVAGGNILYGNKSYDHTQKFLRYAKKKYID